MYRTSFERTARSIRPRTVAAAAVFFALTGCVKTAPSSDPTLPRVSLLKWEKNASGGQGAQTTVQPGGSFAVDQSFLGSTKADIRIYGNDNEGVRQLKVTGSGTGKCSTKAVNGQIWTAPGSLGFSFPAQVETAKPGTVEDFMAIHLDDLLADRSCGTHQYANMPKPQEFFMDSGTWTVSAESENCCAGKATATFTVSVT
jgi:hypothetical protein